MSRPYKKPNSGGGRGGGRFGGGGPNNDNHRFDGGAGRNYGRANSSYSQYQQGGGGGGGGGYRNNNNNNNNNNKGNNNNNNKGNPNSSLNTGVMKTLLKLLFEKIPALDPNTGMLDLTNMSGAPDLQAVSRSVEFNSVAFCKTLAEALRDAYGHSIRVIRLDNNGISKLAPILDALVDVGVHQNITAISAVDNNISDLSFLVTLKRYTALNELFLVGNPARSNKEYYNQIVRALPALCLLDGEPATRQMLALANPVAPSRTPEETNIASQLTQFIDINLLQPMMYSQAAAVIEQRLSEAYAADGILSISRTTELMNRHKALLTPQNMTHLDKNEKNTMFVDFAVIRHPTHFRNLIADVQTVSETSRGVSAILKRMKEFIVASKPAIRVQVSVNPLYNVTMIEANMKVPIALVTLHGTIRYMWNPPKPYSGSGGVSEGIFQEGREPFLTAFFDRTISLTCDQNRFYVYNDIILCRPDRIVHQEDGSPSPAVFIASTSDRVERLRRRFLPQASFDVMNAIVYNSLNDRTVQQFAQNCAANLSPDELQSVDRVRAFLGI